MRGAPEPPVEKPTDTKSRRHLPRSIAGLILLGAGVFLLLALVAAVSRAHHTPGGHAGVHSPPSGVGDYLFSIFALLAVAVTLFMIWLFFSERDLLVAQRKRGSRSTGALISILAFALIAAGITHLNGLRRHGSSSLGSGKNANALKRAHGLKGGQRAPEFKWLPVFIATAAGLAVLGFLGIRSMRRERRGLLEAAELEQAFEELVEDTLGDLYAETDPRKAIIAAYVRVERLFATYGSPRHRSEAPVEYLERVLPELRASGAALRRLTALFEWAKFSAHDVDRPMRDEAIGALVEVRDELRANRIEDEIRKAPKPLTIRQSKRDRIEREAGS
jgi:hypothetical protein